MYTYNLHDFEAKNDLKRLQATGKYKLVHEWAPQGGEGTGAGSGMVSQPQSITTSACINSVESPLILAATFDRFVRSEALIEWSDGLCGDVLIHFMFSFDYTFIVSHVWIDIHVDRKLLVMDSVSGRICRNIDSGHDRSIHCIALPNPSVHVPLSQLAYNIFATAATDNVISLWDLRAPRGISRLTSHVNRREKCQCSFSPCLRYLAMASEDRSARIFDIRGGKEIAKLVGQPSHRDVVSSVAYHPIHPQLVTASYDGGVKCYVGGEELS